MTLAVRENLIVAALAALRASPVTVPAAQVERDRSDVVQKWPFLVLRAGPDLPEGEQLTGLETRRLTLQVEIHTTGDDANSQANAHYAEIHRALCADRTLGVDGVRFLEVVGLEPLELLEDERDAEYAAQVVLVEVIYEHAEDDPTDPG